MDTGGDEPAGLENDMANESRKHRSPCKEPFPTSEMTEKEIRQLNRAADRRREMWVEQCRRDAADASEARGG